MEKLLNIFNFFSFLLGQEWENIYYEENTHLTIQENLLVV